MLCNGYTDFFPPISRRYADHVGIHYVLCSKLRQFAYEELEFFLPQYVVVFPRIVLARKQDPPSETSL
ncbi:hypothetical protein P153DRAFT_369384 [Dothidotthia symphoricarpi CBS 119687]|uniref:Uncharacterized protein n=1 Tax=Dothidotthia symphoricarpi CBS 119687 TaxID=1392245 RepID=A0A6A6A4A5_9PLEO|nr:uncharacterized protein P153DRAFT_369384 [Dothidotthia symphoricarpi CBS 119687]KAF2126005.1 hypothetical protein P153DRAFT_369384 [Dothidotthia symphoricarpi CBS 119687]